MPEDESYRGMCRGIGNRTKARALHTSPFSLTFSSSYTQVSTLTHSLTHHPTQEHSHYTAHTTSPTASSLCPTSCISLCPAEITTRLRTYCLFWIRINESTIFPGASVAGLGAWKGVGQWPGVQRASGKAAGSCFRDPCGPCGGPTFSRVLHSRVLFRLVWCRLGLDGALWRML